MRVNSSRIAFDELKCIKDTFLYNKHLCVVCTQMLKNPIFARSEYIELRLISRFNI